jgi:16S rRNA (guanine527-N7)-methyltransferase
MIHKELEKGLFEAGLTLSCEAISAFSLYSSELIKWNRKFNLTAINNVTDIAIKHIIDSLFFIECIGLGESVLDIGSGAGIPAIPLKIVKPGVKVVSVDAVGKKIMFQKHVSRLLGLCDFEALHARVESIHSSHAGMFDVVTSRAFSQLDMFAALALPLLKSGGRLIAMKGPDAYGEIDSAQNILNGLGLEIHSVKAYELPMNKGSRYIVTIIPSKPCQ